MKTLDKGFKSFTLLHEEKDQFCRFEPTDDPEPVAQIAHLYSLGYVAAAEPEGFEQRVLHEL